MEARWPQVVQVSVDGATVEAGAHPVKGASLPGAIAARPHFVWIGQVAWRAAAEAGREWVDLCGVRGTVPKACRPYPRHDQRQVRRVVVDHHHHGLRCAGDERQRRASFATCSREAVACPSLMVENVKLS